MHAFIISSHLLNSTVLISALKNCNVQSSLATPRTLTTHFMPITDGIVIPHLLSEREQPYFVDFLANLSSKIPIIFLSPGHKRLFKDEKLASYLSQSIFLEDTLPLAQIPLLIKDILQKNPPERELKFGKLTMDRLSRTLSMGEASVALSKKEFFLLELLILNSGRVTTRENIIDFVWDKRNYVSQNTIDVYISRLRKKLHPKSITTFPCLGYQLNLNN